MPVSRNILTYPQYFWDIAEALRHATSPLTFTFDSKGKCVNFRQRFYAFRNLMEEPLLRQALSGVTINLPAQPNTLGQWEVHLIPESLNPITQQLRAQTQHLTPSQEIKDAQNSTTSMQVPPPSIEDPFEAMLKEMHAHTPEAKTTEIPKSAPGDKE